MNAKTLMKLFLVTMLAVVAVLPASLAVESVYGGWGAYGEPRIGSFYSQHSYGLGFYDYISPPYAQVHRGSIYKAYGIREAQYPSHNVETYLPQFYRPYYAKPHSFGYDFYGDRRPTYWLDTGFGHGDYEYTRYTYSGGHGSCTYCI